MTKHKKTEQNRHQRLIRWRKVLSVLSMVVVSVTTYALILPAITSSTQTWCGLEEHTHDDSCYEQRLVCGLEEGAMTTILLDAGHKHSDACYEMRQVLVCGQTEREPNEAEHDPGHIHTEACYETKRVLACGEVEHEPVTEEMTAHHHTEACYERVLCCTKSEHTHEELCYSNPNQIETPEQWELELPLEERSGVWADDLLLIANSQLGFRESEENYTLIDGERQGYTRFGDWYGQRYGNWNATFVSFCLSYADIPERFVPYASEAADWVDTLQEQGLYRMRQEDENGQPVADYLPKKGDLVFFADEESESKSPVRVGIVQDLSVEDDETRLITVEGDADGEVASCSYELNAAAIVGFAELPERPEWLAAFQTTGRAPAAAPTEPQNEEENDTAKAGPSFNNAANVLRGADRNTLRFQGRDFEILAQYPDNAEIPEGAWLAVTELTKNDAAYAEHAQEAAAQLTEDQELTYARFFDIRIMNAEGEEVELANDAEVKVEIRLLDQTTLAPDESINVVHFTENSTELIEPELTTRTLEDELQTVRFRAGGFSIWGVVGSKTHEPRQLTAEAEGVQVLLDAPGQARLPEGARLEAVELQPGTEQYEACYAEAERLLSEEKGEPVSICFARFFDLTILNQNGKELEPSAAVNVSFDYEEQFQLSLGQEMFVVHFADEGAELIQTELSRPFDENGEEQEGTCVLFQQSSFSITGTVLTGDDLIHDSDLYGGIYNGFPKTSASYYVTFDAVVDGETKTYAMGYGGIVEEVTRENDTIIFNSGVATDKAVSDEWYDSFVWYYSNEAYFNNPNFAYSTASGAKKTGDSYGNFLSNDKPFAVTPAGGYSGGTKDLAYSVTGTYSDSTNTYKDYLNLVKGKDNSLFPQTYWDKGNYTYTVSNDSISGTIQPRYGPIGGLYTFIVREKYNNDAHEGTPTKSVVELYELVRDSTEQNLINRPARSIYIDSRGNVRLASRAILESSSGSLIIYPKMRGDKDTIGATTINSTRYILCDPVLVLDKGYWKWVYPYAIGPGEDFPNAVKVTNLQFSSQYTTVGVEPANPSDPLSDILDQYNLAAPENSKSLMPNNNGDGTYSLALSVMGDSHAAYSKIMADILIVADLSNSMLTVETFVDENGQTVSRTRLAQLKRALSELNQTLLGGTTDKSTVIAMNMLTFGSTAQDYNRSWVTSEDAFASYIASIPDNASTLLGATNWEDALERAYTLLKNRRAATENDGFRHIQYLIFLTDGDPTAYMTPRENQLPNDYDWAWDFDYGSAPNVQGGYLGSGSTQPMNVYYSLLEARDNAREIVWGLDKGMGMHGLYEPQRDPQTGEVIEDVATYMYAIATFGNADTLTNLLAYAYNGSLEATYPERTFIEAKDERQLKKAFQTITKSIKGSWSYSDVSIYDPCTENTHVAAEMDQSGYEFHYYRYRCDSDFNILNEETGKVEYWAVKHPDYDVVGHYEVRDASGNTVEIIPNIYERLQEWDRMVTVKDYSNPDAPGTERIKELSEAEFGIEIFDTENNVSISFSDLLAVFTSETGKPSDDPSLEYWLADNVGSKENQNKRFVYRQTITWDLSTKQPYTDVMNESSNRFQLEPGYAYTVTLTVWPTQRLYDSVASIHNEQVDLDGLKDQIDTDYMLQNGDSFDYFTNLRDGDGNSLATVDYASYSEYPDSTAPNGVGVDMAQGSQNFINPQPMPLAEHEINVDKTWIDSLDETQMEIMIARKLEEMIGKPLAQITEADLADKELEKLYGVQLVLLNSNLGEDFSTADPNLFTPEFDKDWVYFNYNGANIGAYSMFFYPQWHFDVSQHRVVVDERTTLSESLKISVGTMVSAPNFDPLNIPYEHEYGDGKPVRLQKEDGTWMGGNANPTEYYILEEGFDYTLREYNADGTFSLNSIVYHPMLIDGTLYDVKFDFSNQNGAYYTATIKPGDNTLHATNTIRSQLTIAKETLEQTQNGGLTVLYEKDALGNPLKPFIVTLLGKTVEYHSRPSDSFTIRAEITLDPEQTQILAVPKEGSSYEQVPGLCYVVYPAYLDQMVSEGTLTEAELDACLTYGYSYTYKMGEDGQQSAPQSFEGVRYYFDVIETEEQSIEVYNYDTGAFETVTRELCTVLRSDITIDANQHVRVYNLPEHATVGLYEINNPMAWEHVISDWQDPSGTHVLYGSEDVKEKLSLSGDCLSLTPYLENESQIGTGFARSVTEKNEAYSAKIYNLLLPLDVELKKIGTSETDRDKLQLSNETDPAGTGLMYDDSKVTGLLGAKFLLYQQVDPVPVSEMAAKGIVWLLPDGTTTSEGTPENGVQVIPARNYYQEAITLDAATDSDGRLRIRNLLAGTYYLVESQPPVGYHLNDVVENSVRYLTINLSNDGMSYLQPDANGGQTQNALSRLELVGAEHQPVLEMLVINSKPGEALPQTGGPGRKQLSVLGIALVLFGAAALMIRKNRRKEDRA